MKIIIFSVLISVFSVTAFAEGKPKSDKSVVEFSKVMGVNNIIEATMQQTRDALKTAMIDLSSDLKAKYPNLSDEQNKVLEEIFNKYVDSVIDSIDVDKASYIYTNVIAEGMSKKEVEVASQYYATPEGQNLLKVIGIASSKLNQYMLDKVTESAKIAQSQLGKDLLEFKNSVSK